MHLPDARMDCYLGQNVMTFAQIETLADRTDQ